MSTSHQPPRVSRANRAVPPSARSACSPPCSTCAWPAPPSRQALAARWRGPRARLPVLRRRHGFLQPAHARQPAAPFITTTSPPAADCLRRGQQCRRSRHQRPASRRPRHRSLRLRRPPEVRRPQHPARHPVALRLGKLAFVSNVGTLVDRMTKAQYNSAACIRPRGLYSHADQVRQWHTSVTTRDRFARLGRHRRRPPPRRKHRCQGLDEHFPRRKQRLADRQQAFRLQHRHLRQHAAQRIQLALRHSRRSAPPPAPPSAPPPSTICSNRNTRTC